MQDIWELIRACDVPVSCSSGQACLQRSVTMSKYVRRAQCTAIASRQSFSQCGMCTVATDIFSISCSDYLVDTYSTFIEIHFDRHGRPDIVISDNGPPYSSAAFAQFAHETVSLMEPQKQQ
jgi:hypothetical protein